MHAVTCTISFTDYGNEAGSVWFEVEFYIMEYILYIYSSHFLF